VVPPLAGDLPKSIRAVMEKSARREFMAGISKIKKPPSST
jgi:hypothetical protein